MRFGPKQRNETAAYTLLALLDLQPDSAWVDAKAQLRGITPIIDFIATGYGNRYALHPRNHPRPGLFYLKAVEQAGAGEGEKWLDLCDGGCQE